ncbi:MAG: MBL fold metallo-hydrolase [Clostridiales bacterium]|nr:MBL fold metallo-hydrolase [Candidatus Blautia equi]
MKLTMLGTGNALVTECYNTCFVIEDNGKCFMVDGGGGNGVLQQLKRAGYNWMDMRQIFVTHKHVDHLMGIIWMVRLICQYMGAGEYDGEAFIYSHKEVLELIQDMAEKLLGKKVTRFIGDRLHLVEIHDGEKKNIIDHEVTFFNIHSTKAEQYGFCMDLGAGKKLTCCGDEPYKECEKEYAMNSEWLLHEAFCLYGQRDVFHPYEKSHSTVKDACEVAEMLQCKNLVLYHTEDSNMAERKKLYLAEGSEYYSGNLLIPDDLETIVL